MSEVKQFDFARWARLKNATKYGDEKFDLLVLPGDINRVEADGELVRIYVNDMDRNVEYVVHCTLQDVEDACNVALSHMKRDVEKATEEELFKRGLSDKYNLKKEAN